MCSKYFLVHLRGVEPPTTLLRRQVLYPLSYRCLCINNVGKLLILFQKSARNLHDLMFCTNFSNPLSRLNTGFKRFIFSCGHSFRRPLLYPLSYRRTITFALYHKYAVCTIGLNARAVIYFADAVFCVTISLLNKTE